MIGRKMEKAKELLLMIPSMNGGGAERVLGILASRLAECGHRVTLMLTNQKTEDAVGYSLHPGVTFASLVPLEKADKATDKVRYSIIKQSTRVLGTCFEKTGHEAPDSIAHGTFMWQYHRKVRALREYLMGHPGAEIIVFCQPAVNIALLAAEGLPNQVVLSERLDPERYGKNRYMPYFVRKWYPKAKHLVFQTESARSYFGDDIKEKSSVIPNPLNPGLPEPYHGPRDKTIVTFCRLTPQKNLKMLIDAFAEVYVYHPDCTLEINGEGESEKEIRDYIDECGLSGAVRMLPFDGRLHRRISTHAMFVSSSDYEGMSNSMLEALAIGLPCICTDCPAGGARAIIRDHENGILVPVGDRNALAEAMRELMEDPGLSDKLSSNGAKIREELDVKVITDKWLSIL